MKKLTLALTTLLVASSVSADLLDPDCTAEKAAKSAVAKSTIGIGGRCTPAEAVKDTAADKIDDLAPHDKGSDKALDKLDHDDEPSAKKAIKKALN
ncbi:MAG: hypothetical protein HWE39_14970 [Oceanospirillaceae bacterium]|nr:hypothetical protein [Oceanospirillaceae bacterium]